jgi:hypothetical protein
VKSASAIAFHNNQVRDSPDTAPSAAQVNDREERPRSTPNLTTSFRGTHVVTYTMGAIAKDWRPRSE